MVKRFAGIMRFLGGKEELPQVKELIKMLDLDDKNDEMNTE